MLACVGISHQTAPQGKLEQVFLSEQEIRLLLPELKSLGIAEGVLHSSPSRTELYAFSDKVEILTDAMIYFLRKKKAIEATVPSTDFISLTGLPVIEHLFSVVTGIDSMIVGDNRVLGELRAGFTLAQESGASGPVMRKLFDAAFRCSSKACATTAISEGAISVSGAAVDLAQHIFDELKRKTTLIIGSGETVQSMAQSLKERGIGALYVTHISAEKAVALAKSLGGVPIPFETFRDQLPGIDIVLSSLQGAPFVLSKQDMKKGERSRTRSALLLIDLGMPRNIDPFVTELEQVFLYDLDTLNILVGENISRRRHEVPQVQRIISEEIARMERSGEPWNLLRQSHP
jgi:glutamyl-tRNA reductase